MTELMEVDADARRRARRRGLDAAAWQLAVWPDGSTLRPRGPDDRPARPMLRGSEQSSSTSCGSATRASPQRPHRMSGGTRWPPCRPVTPTRSGLLIVVVYDAYYTHRRCSRSSRNEHGSGQDRPCQEGTSPALVATAGRHAHPNSRCPVAGRHGTGRVEPSAKRQVADPDRVWSEEEIASWSE